MANLQVVIVAAVMIALLHSTEAAEYVVGDSSGWQTPSNPSFYSSWASSRNFTIGDILTFNFATGAHAVATVTADAYNNCNTANPINVITSGPTNITLNATGMHYYICTFPGHCSSGQKLAVNVGGNGSSTTPSPPGTPVSPSPPPPPPPPPANSSASSIAANVALICMSITMGFVFC